MFGHVAGRRHPSRWLILSLLLALAFVWSLALMGDRIGGSWDFLRLGLAVALGVSLLRLGFIFVSSRRRRSARKSATEPAGGSGEIGMRAGGPPSEEQPTDRPLTYEEIFHGAQPDLNGSIDHGEAPEGEPHETSVAQVEAPEADPRETIDQVEAIEADLKAQESLRRMREEFKTRAKEAELRVKQRQAEFQESSAPKSPQAS